MILKRSTVDCLRSRLKKSNRIYFFGQIIFRMKMVRGIADLFSNRYLPDGQGLCIRPAESLESLRLSYAGKRTQWTVVCCTAEGDTETSPP